MLRTWPSEDHGDDVGAVAGPSCVPVVPAGRLNEPPSTGSTTVKSTTGAGFIVTTAIDVGVQPSHVGPV